MENPTRQLKTNTVGRYSIFEFEFVYLALWYLYSIMLHVNIVMRARDGSAGLFHSVP